MNTRQYINSRFEKIISENINEKADAILQRLNYDEEAPFNPAGKSFDYVQEGMKETCEQCGSEMNEGECSECGYQNEEIMELGGMDDGHPKYGKMNFSKLSRKEIEKIMKDMDNMEDDDEEEFVDYDDIVNFLHFHYLTNKDNTPFWRDYEKTTVKSDKLQKYLNVWKERTPNGFDTASQTNNFGSESFLFVGLGIELFSRDLIKKENEVYNLDEKLKKWRDEYYAGLTYAESKSMDHRLHIEKLINL